MFMPVTRNCPGIPNGSVCPPKGFYTEQKPPSYWIPFPEVCGPVARIVASPFPTRAE